MTAPTEQSRARRLERLQALLTDHLADAQEAIETLLSELDHGVPRSDDWKALHIAAARDDNEVGLGTAYQELLTRRRVGMLDPKLQVCVLMHAADFFQGFLGDAELAQSFLQRVLEVQPDHREAFDRLERARRSAEDHRGLVELCALVARDPPVPRNQLASLATDLITALPDWLALSEETCNHLLPLVPANPPLLTVIHAHCHKTGRPHLGRALSKRAFYFNHWAGEGEHLRARRGTASTPAGRAKLQLHGLVPSTYTRTARLACIEKGVAHEFVELDFRSASHAALHPFMKMPAATIGGVTLYETLAICSYVDTAFDGPPLQPEDPLRKARMLQWVSTSIDYLYKALIGGARANWKNGEDRRRVEQVLKLIEAELERSPFLVGQQLSLADLFVGPMLDLAANRSVAPLAPATESWLNTLRGRHSFRRTGG